MLMDFEEDKNPSFAAKRLGWLAQPLLFAIKNLQGELQVFVIPSGEVSNFLIQDFEKLETFMDTRKQQKKHSL